MSRGQALFDENRFEDSSVRSTVESKATEEGMSWTSWGQSEIS